jgi:hypothetical protein
MKIQDNDSMKDVLRSLLNEEIEITTSNTTFVGKLVEYNGSIAHLVSPSGSRHRYIVANAIQAVEAAK